MRHSHGLRAATPKGPGNIGDFYQGGYFAGYISETANGVATHALVVAPASTGASGSGHTLTTNYQWKTTQTTTTGTASSFNGRSNTDAMITAGIALHPAAQFCVNLTIGGYTDWYLPSRLELDIAYQNLKPTTALNNTSWGTNAYSVPARSSSRTSTVPGQTSVTLFQSGNAEAFLTGGSAYWSSSEFSSGNAWILDFLDGFQANGSFTKTSLFRVRAFRKVPV